MKEKGEKESIGVFYALLGAAIWGMFPILVNRGTRQIPPVMFAAVTTMLAALGALGYAIIKGKLHELRKKKAYSSLMMITFCTVIIPFILFCIGSSMTSGINSSVLLLSEIIFTLIVTHMIGEKTTKLKVIGSSGVFFGAILILYKGGALKLNMGDVLIIFSTATYPVGNFFTKKAMIHVSPAIILFVRFLLGSFFLLAFAFLFETHKCVLDKMLDNWQVILLTGLITLGIGKVIWFESLKRLDISKAIMLAMTFPLFSLFVLIFFFGEYPSKLQWIGMIVMAVGVYFSIRRPSVDAQLTRYAE